MFDNVTLFISFFTFPFIVFFFFSSRRRHTRCGRDWSFRRVLFRSRLARDGEKFLALDGKTYALKPEMCVVADQERAIGIGGVMGGEETGVSDSTTTILLEAA